VSENVTLIQPSSNAVISISLVVVGRGQLNCDIEASKAHPAACAPS
jgi:hypothetical protein